MSGKGKTPEPGGVLRWAAAHCCGVPPWQKKARRLYWGETKILGTHSREMVIMRQPWDDCTNFWLPSGPSNGECKPLGPCTAELRWEEFFNTQSWIKPFFLPLVHKAFQLLKGRKSDPRCTALITYLDEIRLRWLLPVLFLWRCLGLVRDAGLLMLGHRQGGSDPALHLMKPPPNAPLWLRTWLQIIRDIIYHRVDPHDFSKIFHSPW